MFCIPKQIVAEAILYLGTLNVIVFGDIILFLTAID